MPCYHPLRGWRSRQPNANGNFPIVFDRNAGWLDKPVSVPCGRCIGCRLDRSVDWAVRCVHESSLHEQNCFITLTYDQDKIPPDGSLEKDVFPSFIKRLRAQEFRDAEKENRTPRTIRYFYCGEYGDSSGRPHYHACLFGYEFTDKTLYKNTQSGSLYNSALADRLWRHGFVVLGNLTFDSAAYVARYCTKKVTGEKADDHYQGRLPEFARMSLRPAIGSDWFDKYSDDVTRFNNCVVDGRLRPVPGYYDKKLQRVDERTYTRLKMQRLLEMLRNCDNATIERLSIREQVAYGRFNLYNEGAL